MTLFSPLFVLLLLCAPTRGQVPEAAICLDHLKVNRQYWSDQVAIAAASSSSVVTVAAVAAVAAATPSPVVATADILLDPPLTRSPSMPVVVEMSDPDQEDA